MVAAANDEKALGETNRIKITVNLKGYGRFDQYFLLIRNLFL